VFIIGLSLLAILAIIAFFDFGKRFFARLGLKEWILFLFILSLVIGVLVPPIQVLEYAFISVGGFIVPIIFTVILLYSSGAKKNLSNFSLVLIFVSVSSLAIFVFMRDVENVVLIAIASGFAGGVVAFLVGKKRAVVFVGGVAGVIFGDVFFNFLSAFVFERQVFLGGGATFNSFIIVPFVALILLESFAGLKKRKQVKKGVVKLTSFEVAEDIDLTKEIIPEEDIIDLLK